MCRCDFSTVPYSACWQMSCYSPWMHVQYVTLLLLASILFVGPEVMTCAVPYCKSTCWTKGKHNSVWCCSRNFSLFSVLPRPQFCFLCNYQCRWWMRGTRTKEREAWHLVWLLLHHCVGATRSHILIRVLVFCRVIQLYFTYFVETCCRVEHYKGCVYIACIV